MTKKYLVEYDNDKDLLFYCERLEDYGKPWTSDRQHATLVNWKDAHSVIDKASQHTKAGRFIISYAHTGIFARVY